VEPDGWSLWWLEGLVAGAWCLEGLVSGAWWRWSLGERLLHSALLADDARAWCRTDHRLTCHSTAQRIMAALDCEPAMLATRYECHAGCGDGCSIHHHVGRNADLERREPG
jgi:hypothetical protein